MSYTSISQNLVFSKDRKNHVVFVFFSYFLSFLFSGFAGGHESFFVVFLFSFFGSIFFTCVLSLLPIYQDLKMANKSSISERNSFIALYCIIFVFSLFSFRIWAIGIIISANAAAFFSYYKLKHLCIKKEQEQEAKVKLEKFSKEKREESLRKKETSQKKLHIYLNAIIENFHDVSSGQDSSDEALARAINDSIDKISQDDIQPINFLSSIVQADLKTIIEHLEHHNLAKHLVFKKLKATFATKTKLAQEQHGGNALDELTTLDAEITKQLAKSINEIFSYILQLPAEKPEDTKMLLQAINSTISQITINSDTIKSAYYQEPVAQSNIRLVLEHLKENQLSDNLVAKRLKNLFAVVNEGP